MWRLAFFRGKYYAYSRENGQPRRVSLRTADLSEAQRRLADYENTLKRKATTVSEIVEDYLADRGPRIAALQTAKFNAKRILPAFGHLRPDQVNRAVCREYVARRREQGISDNTIRRELAVLSAALHWTDKHTPAIVEMPPQPPPKSRHLTRAEYRALREAAKKVPHMHLFVVLAYSTAGRAGAILDLTWDRVDFERGQIRLGTGEKRAKGRATVPMTDGARAALEVARKGAVTDHVIEYANQPLKSIKRAFKAAAARAGLPRDTSPHILRHSAAVHMAESGISMAEIAQFLSHTTEKVTFATYARYSPDYLRRAASALES